MPLTIWTVAKNFFLIAVGGAFPFDDTYNLPSWYLCVLLLCYMWYWIICHLANRFKILPIWLFLFMSLLGTGIVAYGINIPFFNYWSGRGYSTFFFGLVFVELIRRISRIFANKMVSMACLSIIIGTIICGLLFPYVFLYSQNFVLSFIFYPALIGFLTTSTYINKVFNHRFFGVIGGISFEIYIWHFTLLIPIMTIGKYLGILDKFNDTTLFWVIVYTVLFSTIAYFFLEKPLRAWVQKLIQRWMERASKS